MKPVLRLTITAVAVLMAGQALAEVTFFERENFQGRSFTAQQQVPNLQRSGFNDRASSMIELIDFGKDYGDFTAVERLNLKINEGDLFWECLESDPRLYRHLDVYDRQGPQARRR